MSWMSDEYRQGFVSVIVPTFNRANLIVRALDSVFAQTYRPIELIVVDDGSADATQPVLHAWAEKHRSSDFAVKLVLQANQGAQVARNSGLVESAGEYIQFLDSDDRLLDCKLAIQTQFLNQTGADYCYGRTEVIGVDGKVICVQGKPKYEQGPWIAEHAWHTNSPLFRRQVCVAVGPWDTSLSGCQEYEYAARIKSKGFRCGFLPEILDQAFMHDGLTISGQDSQKYANMLELASQRVLTLLPRCGNGAYIERNHIRNNLIAIALRYARNGDRESARRCLSTAADLLVPGRVNLARILLLTIRIVPETTVLETARLFANVTRFAQRLRA